MSGSTALSAPRSYLKIAGVSHEFRSRGTVYKAVDDIDLDIAEGEFFCLIGPSGCGKTTLLDIFAGFIRPTRGSVLLGGEPVREPGNDRVVVFQDVYNSLFPWMTVAENVEFGLRMARLPAAERNARVGHYLTLVNLSEHSAKFPDELSGGMKQRVQLARALAIEPKVLLMDEPFGALDAFTRRSMQEELLRIWGEIRTTVVFITHDMFEAVLLADRIGVMGRGPSSRIISVESTGLERPRAFADPRFAAAVGRLEVVQKKHAGLTLDKSDHVP